MSQQDNPELNPTDASTADGLDRLRDEIVPRSLPDELPDLCSKDIDELVDRARAAVRGADKSYLTGRKARLFASAAACSLFLHLGEEKSPQLEEALRRKGIKDAGRKNRLHRFVQLIEGPILHQIPDPAERRREARSVSNYALLWEAMVEDFREQLLSGDLREVAERIGDAGGQDAFAAIYRAKRDGASTVTLQVTDDEPFVAAEIEEADSLFDPADDDEDEAEAEDEEDDADDKPDRDDRASAGSHSGRWKAGVRETSVREMFDALTTGAEDLSFDLDDTQAASTPDTCFALLRRDGKQLKSYLVRGLPAALIKSTLKYVDPENIARLPSDLNTWGDILLVGQILTDRTTNLPVLPGEDPQAESTLTQVSRACYLWTEGGDFGIANHSVKASVVLDAKPKTDLGLPKRLLSLDIGDLKQAQTALAPPRERVGFADPAAGSSSRAVALATTGDRVTAKFTEHETKKSISVRLEPATADGAGTGDHSWLVCRTDYRPSPELVIGGEAIESLQTYIKKMVKGRYAKLPISVRLGGAELVIDNDETAPLRLSATTCDFGAEVSVKVLGSDLLEVVQGALAATRGDRLVWRADPEGLLEVRFGTQWADYGAYIPTLLEDDGQFVRNPRLLMRVAL
jgi:hypothetical protein